LNKGIKKFGKSVRKQAQDEMKHKHDRLVFQTINVDDMFEFERKPTSYSLMFLMQKTCGWFKARTFEN